MNRFDPTEPGRTRTAIAGVIVGMTALAGTIIGIGATAGADDTPSSATGPATDEQREGAGPGATAIHAEDFDFTAFDECMAEQLGDLEDLDGEVFIEEGEAFGEFPEPSEEELARWEAADAACQQLLPQAIQDEIAAWQPYEECIDDAVGDLEEPWMDGDEPTDEDWEAFDAAWSAADEQCRDLLPEDVQAEMAAWDAFDQCLQDAGLFDESLGGVVHIETGDGLQIVEFGDVEGSVTISGTAGDLTVTSSGGVTVLSEADLEDQWEASDAEFEAAHKACEDQLPDELKGDLWFDEAESTEDS